MGRASPFSKREEVGDEGSRGLGLISAKDPSLCGHSGPCRVCVQGGIIEKMNSVCIESEGLASVLMGAHLVFTARSMG